jgi:hypothetical protein
MNNIFMFLAMIFMHIFDDYCLQGILASMKQKSWWQNHDAYKELYKYDYIVALIMHSFSWSFMVMMPIAFAMSFSITIGFVVILLTNMIVHCVVDDLKANKLKINLIYDQAVHIAQIVITFMIFHFCKI